MTDGLKQTPLNAAHKALGARMVPFGGWEMPVQYAGVIEEHLAVRERAGLFDVSHMGEIEVRGANALALVQMLTTNDAAKLADGQIQYSALCYPDGGVVDDVTLYRSSATHFLFCVNASNTDKDFAWMQQVHAGSGLQGVTLVNRSAEYGQLALQGPKSAAILARLTTTPLESIRYYHFGRGEVAGVPALISRTGYTGEDGFELYVPAAEAGELWTRLLDAGAGDGLQPIGLGARDTLRLEKGYALYGHELSPQISPLEAGLGWIVKFEKGDFIGRDALLAQKAAGVPRRLVGLVMEERGIPREGYPVFAGERQVGTVTSGTMSPSLKTGIALALVESPRAVLDSELLIGIRDRKLRARIVKPPFVKK
ncbi:MAG: glycine cleavage system aminomethyltransferase GcvT [Deltaproteobacteria bacterium]|nr:MAG: glycine cleavage system aminomethyltransferase GcvT [Deltaproteobacteria bacterium]